MLGPAPFWETARSPSPMALATQVNLASWVRVLKAVTTPPLPLLPSGTPSGVIWCSTGPRLLAKIRRRCESTSLHSCAKSAMPPSRLGTLWFPRLNQKNQGAKSAMTRNLEHRTQLRDFRRGNEESAGNSNAVSLAVGVFRRYHLPLGLSRKATPAGGWHVAEPGKFFLPERT